jgi:hypothetical protein
LGVCLSICIAHVIGLLLNLVCVSVELVSLFFERIDPLFQLVQRTGRSLKFTIQRLQGLPLIDSENIGIGFPVAESGWGCMVRSMDLQSPIFLQVLFTK